MKAAQLLEASSGQRLARSKADLVYNIATLYYGNLAQQHLIEALESSDAGLAGHLDQVKALIEGRKAAAVDGLRAEVKLADIRQRLLRERNVAAARFELEAQAARIEAARAGHRPTVNLVAATGNRRMSDPVQQPNGLSSSDNASRIGITFEMPLFEGASHIQALTDANTAQAQLRWSTGEFVQ